MTILSVDELVDRFLSWPLPATVSCDLCAVSNPSGGQRAGTNLLTADEARQMVEFILGTVSAGVKDEPR